MSVQPEPVKGVVPMVASVVQPAQQIMVQVPAGMAPGMQMQVQTPSGLMMVQIPAGLAPGGMFAVSLPAQPMMTPQPMMMQQQQQPMMGQPMMVAPTAGAQVAPMMAMLQVVAPNAQVMARDFETTKGKLFEQGTAAYSSGTFDCCSDGIDAPMWCGAVIVGCCVGLPRSPEPWILIGRGSKKRILSHPGRDGCPPNCGF